MTRLPRFLGIWGLAFGCPLAAAAAGDAEPFGLANADPVRAFLGDPRWTAGAAPRQSFDFRAGLILANQYTADLAGSEQILVDAEVTRVDLSVRWRLSGNWALGMTVPIVRTSGGFLDGFIDGWHDTFGLPTGGRKARARDQFEVSYVDGGTTAVFAESGTGIGDVSIEVGAPIRDGLRWAAIVELPTGDEESLRGSGELEASLVVLGQGRFRDRWHYFWGVGATYGEGNSLASSRFEQWRFGGVMGGTRDLTESLRIKAELEWFQAPYDSATKGLGRDALPLTFGVEWRSGGLIWELALEEDLSVNASPDIAFLIGVRYQPGANR